MTPRKGETAPAIEISKLSKSYLSGSRFWTKRTHVDALRDVTLRVERGEIFGLVGRNGYGKTTLIKCVAGLILPTGGGVQVYGHDTVRDAARVRRLIGWVGAEERSFYLRLTSRQNLKFFGRLQGLSDDEADAKIESLSGLLNCEEYLERRVNELSTGNRQKISLIRGMIHNPRLLILDEPTRSLDPFAASHLRTMLADWVAESEHRSILVTSHHLQEVETMSHRIGIMGRGRLELSGALSQLRAELGCQKKVRIRGMSPLGRAEQQSVLSEFHDLSPIVSDGGMEVTYVRGGADSISAELLVRVSELAGGVQSVNTQEVELQALIDQLEHRSG